MRWFLGRTLAVLALGLTLVGSLPERARADDAAALSAALRATRAANWAAADVALAKASGLARDIVTWQRLRAGKGAAAEYPAFLQRHSDWPGLALLRKSGEPVFAKEGDRAAVLAYFNKDVPRTGAGALALARAWAAQGDVARASQAAIWGWRWLTLEPEDQAGLLAEFGPALAPHHAARLDAMLWAKARGDAERMLPLVSDAQARLGRARLGLLAQDRGVDSLIAAVPDVLAKDAGLAFARYHWRMMKDRYDDAGALLLEQSTSAEALGRPEAWAEWRAALARREMRQGDPARAYRMASRHFLTPEGNASSDYADLEWLSGYIALQKLGDPATALTHFRRFRAMANGEISLGRAGYWEGRAHAALGDTEAARAAFAYGAEHQTGFYGLLAAERTGLPMDPALIGQDRYPDWQGAAFMSSSVLKAALLLQRAGDMQLSKRFFLHLAEGLDAQGLGQLADLALSLKEPHIALLIAKQAAGRGVMLYRAYYPLEDAPDGRLPVARELALAIMRRESEFDTAAQSHAGAQGLMQVMPGTAKLVARKLGLPYKPAHLISDPDYNMTIGAHYLAGLMDEFGPSTLLVTSGYNAGPGRPRSWMQTLGDPRVPGVDPVDWIEHVPFTETRNYIMRVTESMMIYRARMAGRPVPLNMVDLLKGR